MTVLHPPFKFSRSVTVITPFTFNHKNHIGCLRFAEALIEYIFPIHFPILPKIRKVRIPGRPIISLSGAPTERISKFVDFHLRPLIEKIPSYSKVTTDFLLKFKSGGKVPSGSLLVTLDVHSLYTNIPHVEEIEAGRE